MVDSKRSFKYNEANDLVDYLENAFDRSVKIDRTHLTKFSFNGCSFLEFFQDGFG